MQLLVTHPNLAITLWRGRAPELCLAAVISRDTDCHLSCCLSRQVISGVHIYYLSSPSENKYEGNAIVEP